MNRLFLSLKEQDQYLENIDPYTVTTWKPLSVDSAINLKDEDPAKEFDDIGANTTKNLEIPTVLSEDQVMILFPPVHRQEVKTPIPKRTPHEIRRDYLYMELAIKIKEKSNCVSLRSPKVSFIHEPNNMTEGALLQVESPTFIGKIEPIPASPSNSEDDLTYLSSKRLLKLKKPRSGVFINEQVTGVCDLLAANQKRKEPISGVVREAAKLSFDPRIMQSEIDAKANKQFIVMTNALGEKSACVEPCRPPNNSKARGTQALFDLRSIIRGNTDIRSLRKDADKSHALIISAVAMLYSKLDDVQLWTGDKVDEVLRFGFCQHSKWSARPTSPPPSAALVISKSKESLLIDLKDLPTTMDIRGYRLTFELIPSVCCGILSPQMSFVCSDLSRCIVERFKNAQTSGLLIEVGDIAMSLWRKDNLYYLFDGYARDETGRSSTKLTKDSKEAACILMNNQISDLCDIALHNATLSCRPNAPFLLHELRVRSVDKAPINEFFCGNEDRSKLTASSAVVRKPVADNFAPNMEDIASVPLDELSILSVLGGRKRKRQAPTKRENISQMSLPGIDPLEAMRTLTEVANTTLETVLDKIEDKIVNKCIVPVNINGKRARRVLVKSDLECLRQTKRNIHRGLEIDQCADKELIPALTLSQELMLPSNMRIMPDATAIVHGTQNLLQVIECNASICVVAPVLAVVMSYKYALSTWDSSIVDFVLNTSKYVQECVPFEQYQMFRAPRNHLPDIQVGCKRFSVLVYSLCVGSEADIEDMLRTQMFPPSRCDRVVLSSTVYNAAIFRRNNFWYLFDAFPCDLVGIRSKSLENGTATLQRFISFVELVQRLRCNQSVARQNQIFSVNRVQVKDVTDSAGLARTFKFVSRPEFKEKEIIVRLAQEQEELVRRNNVRLRELNQVIGEENCRIKKFNKKAGKEMVKGEQDASLLRSEDPIDCSSIKDSSDECEEEQEVEVVPVVEVKRGIKSVPNVSGKQPSVPSTIRETQQESDKATNFDEILRQPFGYACIEPDHFHKIQGSTSLPHRYRFRCDQIRACHFCSIYATLLSSTLKWKDWNFRTVDQCIEEGLAMYQQVLMKDSVERRCISRILVDNMHYHINVERFPNRALLVEQQKKLATRKMPVFRNDSLVVVPLARTLDTYFEKRRYVLLKFPNCTFAIIRRKCFNLFDPYASHEIRAGFRPYRLSIKQPLKLAVPEKNTASWICVPTLVDLLLYIKQRIRARDMNTAYELYTINVFSVDPAVNRLHTFAHHMLAFSLQRNEMLVEPSFEALARSLPDERVKWLDAKPTMVPWSRRLTQNLMGLKRYAPPSCWKSFDCELNGELYSLWSNLHPMCALFQPKYRGRQYAGIHVIAACIASLYPIEEWNVHLMNYIVVEGDRYFAGKMANISDAEHEVALEELSGTVELAAFVIEITMKPLVFGTIYSQLANEFNLKKALLYFFKEPKRRFGVLHCFRRSLAFGISPMGRYFMYDCMSLGAPLFQRWQGGAYLLLCNTLRRLLHCMVLTLRVPCYNVEFTLHSIKCTTTPKEDNDEETEAVDSRLSKLSDGKAAQETKGKRDQTYVATPKKK